MTMKYPFTEDTLGRKLDAGTGLSVYCLTCRRSAVLDVAALVKRARAGPWMPALGFGEGDLLPRVPRRRPSGPKPSVHQSCSDAGQAQGRLDALSMKRERPGLLPFADFMPTDGVVSFREPADWHRFCTTKFLEVTMPRFFFDVSEKEDVYHDASGIMLPTFGAARERALAIVRRLKATPREDDLVCTVRDIGGRRLLEIRFQSGKPVYSSPTTP
ncbi:MAG: hypothetical protein E5Y51_08060 [Mesorhizobium sp.]|nr:MAG: hypothetical protein E5Y51_08060 [Mesorhizobium sp.]